MRGWSGGAGVGIRGRRRRVLVVSHEASRSGAPRVAIEVIRALDESNWDRRVVLRWPGPLGAEFTATGAKVINEPLRRLRVLFRMWSPTRPLANHFERFGAALVILWQRPDIIWCNTVLSACYVKPGLSRGLRVVLHAHEPREWMSQVLRRYNVEWQQKKPMLVGCAPGVCSDLATLTGRPSTEIACLPSVPDRSRILDLASHVGGPAPSAAGVLVGACGSATDAKGVDLWLEMVARIAPQVTDLNPQFVWIGDEPPKDFANWEATHDLRQRVTFTGSLKNPYPWLKALDVFTLTSRVDQFPLVVLEAMHLSRPVVAFAVGDVPVQIGKCGRLVPPLDIGYAAEEVINLLRDPNERVRLGSAAAARAQDHFAVADFGVAVRRIAADGSSLAGQGTGAATS